MVLPSFYMIDSSLFKATVVVGRFARLCIAPKALVQVCFQASCVALVLSAHLARSVTGSDCAPAQSP